ncbi:MAG: FGGY-family carbohydrate kinase [Nitrososphaeria archaeon]|nr:FGGY-family carbohydrate kinase [Nitrososphaeria archaeon]
MECDKEFLISVDIGTTAAKVALVKVEGPQVVSVLSSEYEKGILHPKSLWAESDPEDWWMTACNLIKKIFQQTNIRPSQVIGIGLCNTCPSLIALDSDGTALRPAILYMDQRSIKQARRLIKKVGKEAFAEIAGNRIAPGAFSITSMLWIKENEPEIYKKTYKFVHANGYFASKLTGEVGMDPTNASFTGIFDLKKAQWSDELIEKTGLDKEKLPKIFWSHEKVGEVNRYASKVLGIEKGVPVAMGCADSAASALGCGIIKPGRVFETTGTSTVVAVVSSIPNFDTRILNRCFVIKGLWLHMGAMSTTGASLKWFKDNLCEVEIQMSQKDDGNVYKILDDIAAKVSPGCDGLLFFPYMSGERSPIWDPNARGVFFGLTLSHTKAHMVRAVLEGVAFGLKNNLEIIESLGVSVEEVRAAGAASKSNLWRQIKADVLGKRIAVSSVKDATMIGCAILAGCAAKYYHDIVNVADKFYFLVEDVNIPNELANSVYKKYYLIFKKGYKRFKSMYKEIALVS